MPTDPPARYHHGDLQRALIDAAVEVIAERGAAALSLREVARRAGVSHGAPAHHFRDKAGLLTAVAIEGYRRFADAMQQARAAAGDDPVAALAATGREYVLFAVRERPYFELMFRPEYYNADDAELLATSHVSYEILLESVKAAQARGHAAGLEPEHVALSSWALVHGLAMLWLDGNLQHRVEMPLEQLIDLVLVTSQAVRYS